MNELKRKNIEELNILRNTKDSKEIFEKILILADFLIKKK